jgi:Golgi phosphoprotein 3 (GPP34)
VSADAFPGLETLGTDLILLSPLDKRGSLDLPANLAYGLAGSELIRLVARGSVEIRDGKIVVLDANGTGDPILDKALNGCLGHPKAKNWVARNAATRTDYLEALQDAGTVRRDEHKALWSFTVTDWYVTDTRRASEAMARLDAVADSTGPVGVEEAALAGLAYATGLARLRYRGPVNAQRRKRLKRLARPSRQERRALAESQLSLATSAATSLDVARNAAIEATIRATIDQSIQIAIDATFTAGDGGGGGHHGGGGGGHGGGGH